MPALREALGYCGADGWIGMCLAWSQERSPVLSNADASVLNVHRAGDPPQLGMVLPVNHGGPLILTVSRSHCSIDVS